MANIRVNELAKKLEISNKELIKFLNDNKIVAVTTHSNSMDEATGEKAYKMYKSMYGDKKPEEKEDTKKKDKKPEEKTSKKRQIVMKINPQNISNKDKYAHIANKQAKKAKEQRKVDERKQEILERQKKIEDYQKKMEEKEKLEKQKKAEKDNNIRDKEISKETSSDMIKENKSNPSVGTEDKNRTSNNNNRRNDRRQSGDNQNRQRRNDRNDNRNNDNRNNDNRNDSRDRNFRRNDRNDRNDNRNSDNRNDNRNRGPQGNRRDNNQGGFDKNRRNNNRPNFDRGGFNKDKDEDDSRKNFRNTKRDTKKKAADPLVDDLVLRNKEKVRESKERENKDKYKKREGRFKERNISLERTSKRTHKQALKEKQNQINAEQKKEEVKLIEIPETITIKELCDKMKIAPSVIIKELFMKGQVTTMNQIIDFATAEEIAMEHDILCEMEEKVDVIEELLKEEKEDESKLVPRPPVVCVMGHVDHGKTSLLDAIRKTEVIKNEAGGITQHIGAYVVKADGRKITFLDTPGHEAFTAMRMRGANSTDIAILVVAADDGVMPQTIEAINHARAAGVEIIVAINKIDKPSANVDRVKQELAEQNLIPEDWGGSNIFVPVSAKAGTGIEELLEMVLLTADVLELKANPDRKARGLVLEAKLDKGRGPVANVLVQKGTLKIGDFISAGAASGKVRAMIDDRGRRIKEAGPSTPVEILGLNDVPNAGEILIAHDSDKDAKNFAATFVSEGRERMLEDTKTKMSLDELFEQIKAGNLKELSLVVKADVQGSAEAIKQSLEKLSNDEVVVKIIHSGVGAINESDVVLAGASNAIIIGFNVRPDAQAKNVAEQEGVDIRLYGVIYKAIEDIEAAMKGMLDPVYEEKVIGHAEIRKVFKASGIGNIAGSYVLDGYFERGCQVRITREGEQIFEGDLASLKRFQDDVKEVKAGFECGLVFDKFNDIQELDQVEAYKTVEVPR